MVSVFGIAKAKALGLSGAAVISTLTQRVVDTGTLRGAVISHTGLFSY